MWEFLWDKMLKSFAKYIISISFWSSGEDQYLPYKVILNETVDFFWKLLDNSYVYIAKSISIS